jgi:hypothetical protein
MIGENLVSNVRRGRVRAQPPKNQSSEYQYVFSWESLELAAVLRAGVELVDGGRAPRWN